MQVRGKQRIQLDLSDAQQVALKKVQAKIDANSYSEVFRRALVMLEHVIDREETGIQFGFVDPQTNLFTEIWIL